MKAGQVRVVIENNEALTMTGIGFSDLSDLDVIDLCRPVGIKGITRTDFFLRHYSEEKMKVEPVPGDLCSFAYNVINSETGFRALRVVHYILRYACSNGATIRMGKLIRRVHTGLSPAEMRRFLSVNLLEGEKERERIAAQLSVCTTTDAAPYLERASKTLRAAIGATRVRAVLRTLSEEATRYELINLITREAQNHPPETRLRLEALGGELIMATDKFSASRPGA